jgi:hypothetical protein
VLPTLAPQELVLSKDQEAEITQERVRVRAEAAREKKLEMRQKAELARAVQDIQATREAEEAVAPTHAKLQFLAKLAEKARTAARKRRKQAASSDDHVALLQVTAKAALICTYAHNVLILYSCYLMIYSYSTLCR